MTRDERQELAIDKYRKTSINTKILKGTFNHCTGFGKTTEAKKIVERLKAKAGDFDYHVIVPTTTLAKQWEDRLDKDNHKILTIQSIIANISYYRENKIKTFFLVIDEIHKFAADQFQYIFQVIENIETTHILGLTATWYRLDGKEILLEKFCPIIDIIPIEEARREGWVADYMEYCWGIEFNTQDKEAYSLLNKRVEELIAYFNSDYDSVIGCCSTKDRTIAGKFYRGAISYIKENPNIDLYEYDEGTGSTYQVLEERNKITTITKKANICRQAIQERKSYTDKALCKVEAALEAINHFNMKTITFGVATEVADILTSRLGSQARSYHSNIESQRLNLPNKKGKLRFIKVGKDRLLDMMIDDFVVDKFKYLNTAKKADLGLDVPGLRLGIDIARTSDPGTHDQRKGRVVRVEDINVLGEMIAKEAIYINLYVKGTKEESNLKWMLRQTPRVRWIERLDQIKI